MNDIEDDAKRAARREKWNDSNRSNMNNIGARATAFAERLRAMATEVVK